MPTGVLPLFRVSGLRPFFFAEALIFEGRNDKIKSWLLSCFLPEAKPFEAVPIRNSGVRKRAATDHCVLQREFSVEVSTMKKVSIALIICVLLALLAFSAFAAGGSSMANAANITFDKTYNDTITENRREDYYKFTLNSSGRISLKFNSFMEVYSVTLYDEEGNELWFAEYKEWVSTTGRRTDTYTIDLEKGIYFIKVNGCGWHNSVDGCTGSYNFTLGFTPSGANIEEPNNNIAQAKTVKYETAIKGQIAKNDKEDYYKFSLDSSGKLTLRFNSFMEVYSVTLYDEEGAEIWFAEYKEWVSTTGKRTDNYSIDLEKGMYFIKVNGCGWHNSVDGSTGNYNFTLGFTSSGANIDEPNNNIAQAKAVKLSTTVKGQIAKNDKEDYYKFTLGTSGKVTLKFTSFMEYYSATIYDAEGVETWYTEYNQWNSTTGKRTDTHSINLNKGTYYMKVNGCGWHNSVDGSTGNYSFSISTKVTVAAPKSVKASANKTTSVKLTCSPVSGVTGYFFYRYDTATKKYIYLGASSTTSFTVKKLKAGTKYQFAAKAYKMVNGTKYQSALSSPVKTATRPATPTVSVTPGKKQAVVKWKAVSGANGYLVYRSTSANGTFSKIGTTTGTSFKATKLSTNKTYYFKVVAYTKVGSTTIRSAASKAVGAKIR